MALAWTRHTVQGIDSAPQPVGTLVVPSQRARRATPSAHAIFRRLLAAIVNGSDHPCWRTNDVSAQLAVLPAGDRKRLLDSGRVTTRR